MVFEQHKIKVNANGNAEPTPSARSISGIFIPFVRIFSNVVSHFLHLKQIHLREFLSGIYVWHSMVWFSLMLLLSLHSLQLSHYETQ